MRRAPVCLDLLHYRSSATEALRELTEARSSVELLDTAHAMWCGPACPENADCTFLHYHRPAAMPTVPRSTRSRYNKDTADLFFVMGGAGYAAGTPKTHEMNLWPALRAVLAEADGDSRIDYSDWARKDDRSAAQVVAYACRDTLQWMANWSGERYADNPAVLHYVAFSTIFDDICVPPLDLVSGEFRMYGRSLGDVVAAMDEQGWGHDAVHALLGIVRECLFQYAEKFDLVPTPGRVGLHTRLNDSTGAWDAVVFRTTSANNYGCAIGLARVCDVGPVSFAWLMDSSICDAISMDLCKSTMDVYHLDSHQPTANARLEGTRKTAYHSIYLDLIDDLVTSGAPEVLVHYGRAGFLYVQLQERYNERRTGRRMPLRPAVSTRLHHLFGDEPVDPWIEDRYQAHRHGTRPLPSRPTGLGTSAARIRTGT